MRIFGQCKHRFFGFEINQNKKQKLFKTIYSLELLKMKEDNKKNGSNSNNQLTVAEKAE